MFNTACFINDAGHWKKVKGINAPEFSDDDSELCKNLSPFPFLSTHCPSHLAVLALSLFGSSRQAFVVLDTNMAWQGLDL